MEILRCFRGLKATNFLLVEETFNVRNVLPMNHNHDIFFTARVSFCSTSEAFYFLFNCFLTTLLSKVYIKVQNNLIP